MTSITIDMYANSIVTDALTCIRVVTPFNALTGDDEATGMRMLNSILTLLNTTSATLPFFYDYHFNTEFGRNKYYFGQGELSEIEINYPIDIPYINLFYGQSKYPVSIITDAMALSTMIQTEKNYTFLPSQARVYKEQDPLGITYTVIDFLYPPDQIYQAIFRGKPSLNQAGINDYISQLPAYFHEYLRLQLAYKLAPLYGRDDQWTPMLEAQRVDAEITVMGGNIVDLDVKSIEPLTYCGRYYSSRLGVR